MRRAMVLCVCMILCFSSLGAIANEAGRRNTVLLGAGLTGLAIYEENPIAIAATAIGTLYAAKRYNDDVRNNRREAEWRASQPGYGYQPMPYYPPPQEYYQPVPQAYYPATEPVYQTAGYGDGGVVPASYRNSRSEHISYKGFRYSSSESHSESYRSPPRSRGQAPQVVVVVVNGSGGQYAPMPQPDRYYGENCYEPNQYVRAGRCAAPVPASYGYGPQVRQSPVYYGGGPASSGAIPSSYSHSKSERISCKGVSYGYSERKSASFRTAPPSNQPVVIYYR